MILGGVIQLYVGGAVIGGLTGIDPTLVIAALMGVVSVYILLGGLWSSMTTDFVQFLSAIVITLVFVPFLVFEAGGPGAIYKSMRTNLGPQAPAFLSMANVSAIEDLFLPYALGLGIWGVVSLATWQRIFAVRRDKTSRFLTVGGIGVFTTISMYGVIGVVGLAAFPEAAPGDLTIETLGLLPGWAAVVFLLIVLMVLGSSVDSYLTAIASLTAREHLLSSPQSGSERRCPIAGGPRREHRVRGRDLRGDGVGAIEHWVRAVASSRRNRCLSTCRTVRAVAVLAADEFGRVRDRRDRQSSTHGIPVAREPDIPAVGRIEALGDHGDRSSRFDDAYILGKSALAGRFPFRDDRTRGIGDRSRWRKGRGGSAMIGETALTILLVGFWLAEFAFAGLVTYWFLSEGFADDESTGSEPKPLESSEYTLRSLAMWGGFFAVLLAMIVLGA